MSTTTPIRNRRTTTRTGFVARPGELLERSPGGENELVPEHQLLLVLSDEAPTTSIWRCGEMSGTSSKRRHPWGLPVKTLAGSVAGRRTNFCELSR